MGGEQSSLNLGQAVEACRCDCDTRKDEEGDPRRSKIPVGTATPRGFQEFQRASHTSKNTSTPETQGGRVAPGHAINKFKPRRLSHFENFKTLN